MKAILCLIALASVAVVALAAEQSTVAEQFFGPSYSNPCSSCVPSFPVCLACQTPQGVGAGCFPPNYYSYSCCGCANGACLACPYSSSCARWLPGMGTICPAPNANDNSTTYPCSFNQKSVLRYGEASVYRCANIPADRQSYFEFNGRPNSDGEFTLQVLDQPNFEAMVQRRPYQCLNQNCGLGGTMPKSGSFTAYGTAGVYFVLTKTNQNWSGTSSYYFNGYVVPR